MSIELMKDYILKAYDYAPKWKEKVDKMSDDQIRMIYNRLFNCRKLK